MMFQVLYSLYGLVEHSGRLTGGHYTAYVKVRGESDRARVVAFLQRTVTPAASATGRVQKLIEEMDVLLKTQV